MFRRKGECQKVREMLSPYIDQQLPPSKRELVAGHIAKCPTCRQELESLKATVNLLRRVPLVSPPRSFAIAELQPRWRPAAVALMGTAAAVATLLLAFFFLGDMFNLFGPGLLGGEGVEEVYRAKEAADAGYPAPSLWPLWQLEVAFSALTFSLVAATLFLWQRRRKAAR